MLSLQQQSDMGNQRSLHPLATVCELLHCGSLNTWRKLLTDLRDLYVVFERKAREFQSNHFPRFVTRNVTFQYFNHVYYSLVAQKKSLENQRLNAHLNVTKNLKREFQSNHIRECHFPILQSRLLLTCSTKKSLQNQRLNAHLNVTKNLTRASRSNIGTKRLLV